MLLPILSLCQSPSPGLKYLERIVHIYRLSCLISCPLNIADVTSILIRDCPVSKYNSLMLLRLSAALNDVDGHVLWVLSMWLQ